MVAAGILGIALVGLVRLHVSSMRGTVQAEQQGNGAELARQLAEYMATQIEAPPENGVTLRLPVRSDFVTPCGPGVNAQLPPGAQGCRAGDNLTAGLSDPNRHGTGCSFWTYGGLLPDLATGPVPSWRATQLPGERPGAFRVDMAVSAHPSPANYPDAAMVTIWVCWRDEGGLIRQVTSRRVFVE